MYQLMVQKNFVAQHFLTVPNCGAENEWHSHHFRVEVLLEGPELDPHGYLVDIDELKRQMDRLVARFRDATLNELPEFEGLNPSIEHFSRLFCSALADALETSHLEAVTVKMWEDENAWASYRRPCGSD